MQLTFKASVWRSVTDPGTDEILFTDQIFCSESRRGGKSKRTPCDLLQKTITFMRLSAAEWPQHIFVCPLPTSAPGLKRKLTHMMLAVRLSCGFFQCDTGTLLCEIEMAPHICPSDLLCVLFSAQPLGVNDEQSERCTKDKSNSSVSLARASIALKVHLYSDSTYFIPSSVCAARRLLRRLQLRSVWAPNTKSVTITCRGGMRVIHEVSCCPAACASARTAPLSAARNACNLIVLAEWSE